MSAPGVAALLAREPEVIAKAREHCRKFEKFELGADTSAAFLYDGNVTYRVGDVLREYDALATALRAALEDQRRIDWLEANSSYFSGAIEMDHDSRLNGDALSLRAAIDAALTADGGV